MRYGFIGLGHLGGHLAASLGREGFRLSVNDLNRASAAHLIDLGAVWAESPEKVASNSDAVISCLPSPAASERVLAGIMSGAKGNLAWLEMSTLGPEDVLRLAAIANGRGITMLECPVTGGVHRAATGDIAILVGGEKALLEIHRPALEAMGGEIVHMGPLGSAAAIKVITNMLAFIHLLADGEALMLAKRAGLDLAKAFHAIKASSGNSFVHETEGQLILNGSYDIGFTMDLALKDLGFAVELGRKSGVPLDLATLTFETFQQARARYGGTAWSTKAVKLLEDALETDLRAPGFPVTLTD